MRSLELFTGGGGLALGMAEAGFAHAAVVERDHDSCETLRLNRDRGIAHVRDWRIIEADIRAFDYSLVRADVIGGGVPCQPFSLGGKHRAHEDHRDMFPEFARSVAAIRPKAFIVENVKGLLRSAFADYFAYVILRMSHPTVPIKQGKTWRDHCRELERIHAAGKSSGLDYNVVFHLLNAADYGVPQRRERVFIVGFRSDLGARWSYPEPTHSREALLHQQIVTGEYWERHEVPPAHRTTASYRGVRFETSQQAWRTVRDALSDLQPLRVGQRSRTDPNHYLKPGARAYRGHTGSRLDEPAKTLKAGDHGVPGGENTLALPNGEVRYFSVREAARLQTFPDDYNFAGAWTEQMRQVGNAVPRELARIVASSVAKQLAV